MNQPKCILISNVLLTDINGAANSLRTFLQHQNFLDIDLVLPLFIFNVYKWPQIIRRNKRILPSSVNRVTFFLLPWSRCFEGSQTSAKAVLAYNLSNIFANLLTPLLKHHLERGSYEFAYLNSLTLNRLVSSRYKTVVHVREVLDARAPSISKVIGRLQNAAGLVFIDDRTRDVFKKFVKNRHRTAEAVINNPFDMDKARRLRQKYRSMQVTSPVYRPKETVFSFVGAIDKIKGIDFIIKAFLKAEPKKAKLYVVGSGNAQFFNACKALAAHNKSILFFGRLQPDEIMEIYAASDYVLRGDPDFRIGRTIFEALYTGCRVILPNDQPGRTLVPELTPFRQQILFYAPRNVNSLGRIFGQAAQSVRTDRIAGPSSNIDRHCQQMKTFVQNLLATN